ncbi:MAG TPA: hypothetical protein ENG78_02965 [Acidiferrobacteraceae bacterium]|nr:hypothetical protein [Acidiferrobacteraceae bacterium]HEX19764.1 hypothetical protein [Acidiferrobacteraceae bacterium]
MVKVPKKIDGARVLFHTCANDEADGFGIVSYKDGSYENISGLAICRYSNDKKTIFLFVCNDDWNVVGDMQYQEVNDAIDDALRFYGGSASGWVKTEKRQ